MTRCATLCVSAARACRLEERRGRRIGRHVKVWRVWCVACVCGCCAASEWSVCQLWARRNGAGWTEGACKLAPVCGHVMPEVWRIPQGHDAVSLALALAHSRCDLFHIALPSLCRLKALQELGSLFFPTSTSHRSISRRACARAACARRAPSRPCLSPARAADDATAGHRPRLWHGHGFLCCARRRVLHARISRRRAAEDVRGGGGG